jgi:hypothetical protein
MYDFTQIPKKYIKFGSEKYAISPATTTKKLGSMFVNIFKNSVL